jgi:hypothetical protein
MGACREGWSPVNIQARYPSTTQSGKCALLGCPPHAVPSSLTPALPSPPTGPRWWLRVWSGQAIHTRPAAHTRRPMSTPLCPHSGNRWPLHHPAARERKLLPYKPTLSLLWNPYGLYAALQLRSLRWSTGALQTELCFCKQTGAKSLKAETARRLHEHIFNTTAPASFVLVFCPWVDRVARTVIWKSQCNRSTGWSFESYLSLFWDITATPATRRLKYRKALLSLGTPRDHGCTRGCAGTCCRRETKSTPCKSMRRSMRISNQDMNRFCNLCNRTAEAFFFSQMIKTWNDWVDLITDICCDLMCSISQL